MTLNPLSVSGLQLVPGRWLQSCQMLHGSVATCQSSSGPEPQQAGAGQRERPEEEEKEEGPEYIPRRKAKSPMTMVGYAWWVTYLHSSALTLQHSENRREVSDDVKEAVVRTVICFTRASPYCRYPCLPYKPATELREFKLALPSLLLQREHNHRRKHGHS